MFGRKKDGKKQQTAQARPRNAGMAQLGLLDMGGYYDYDPESGQGVYAEEDDAGLEDELLAITSGKGPTRAKRGRGPKFEDLDTMIKESLKEISSDNDNDDDDDEDLENDPELLAELQQLTPEESPVQSPVHAVPTRAAPSPPTTEQPVTSGQPPPKSTTVILEERLVMYQNAVTSAKTAGESTKVRRLERGVKTIEGLLKNSRAGKTINDDDIPPEVATGAPKPPVNTVQIEEATPLPTAPPESPPQIQITPDKPGSPTPKSPEKPEVPPRQKMSPKKPPELPPRPDAPPAVTPATVVPDTVVDAEEEEKKMTHELLVTRRQQYQQAALNSKKNGDTQTSIKFIRTAKQFEVVISAMEQGQPIDLSQMPPPPPGFEDTSAGGSPKSISLSSPPGSTNEGSIDTLEDEPLDPSVFKAPPPPVSTLEALEQRRDKYLSTKKEAETEGNSSKSRRIGRLVKQYEDAIKLYKAGKPVPYDDLPDPPGFAPIPREGAQKPAAAASPVPSTASDQREISAVVKPKPAQGLPKATPGPSAVARPTAGGGGRKPEGPVKKSALQNIHEKQFAELQERQRLFREAALSAKKRGDIETAKEYLRFYKGFNPMIEASKDGIRVDLDSAPIPPQRRKTELDEDHEFEVIEMSDCMPHGDRDEVYEQLESDLKTQIEMCSRNRDHFSQLGDIHSARKFQLLAEHANKDLTCIKYANKHGDPVPRFHYEKKMFNIVHSFTDLNDNELELTIVRGINYSCSNPKEIDTYVRFEFPYPSDNCPKDRTPTVKDTNNPEYNKSFMLMINRKARAMVRAVKRNSVKLEVVAKGGFFHSDSVLGTVQVKLLPLETKCLIHECFDLMDGRKVVGGKLEVKIRIREPLVSKQVEKINEKWLVIDQYVIK